jgi:hypothetical protein
MTNNVVFQQSDYIMTKENVKTKESAISDTGKDIKKGMDRYEAKIKSGEEPPAGDSTRSEE